MAGPNSNNNNVSISSPPPFSCRGKTDLRFPVALEYKRQRREIQQRENILRALDIGAPIREPVQLRVDPDVRAGIHERACTADNLLIISFALEIDLDLLHVCSPVDFSV